MCPSVSKSRRVRLGKKIIMAVVVVVSTRTSAWAFALISANSLDNIEIKIVISKTLHKAAYPMSMIGPNIGWKDSLPSCQNIYIRIL